MNFFSTDIKVRKIADFYTETPIEALWLLCGYGNGKSVIMEFQKHPETFCYVKCICRNSRTKYYAVYLLRQQNREKTIASIVFNKHKQKKTTPFGVVFFCLLSEGDSKGRPDRREGKKVSGGHFFSPWESPLVWGRIRYGCGHKSNRCCRRPDTHTGICFFVLSEGLEE